MSRHPWTVLSRPDAFWEDVRTGRPGVASLLVLTGFIVAACAVYGAIMAGWRSPRLALYVALKLPLVFLITVGVVSIFNWMAASLLAPMPGRSRSLPA